MANTKPARGMRDFLPADVRKRNYVINIIKEVYESYGFEPLETPSVENLETLTGKYGEEGNQLIYKILKRGEKLQGELNSGAIKSENELSDLALRYDLTVPLARVVANHKNDLPKFFKRYQIQPVWRADRPAKGRFREFYQCDVDAIGSSSMMVEAELCAAVSEILERLGFDDFTIRINHRDILTRILEASGVPTEKHTDALTALDKIDKIGREGVAKEFAERGIVDEVGIKILTFFEFFMKKRSSDYFDDNQKLNITKFLKKNKESGNLVSTLDSAFNEKYQGVSKDSEELQNHIYLQYRAFIQNVFALMEIDKFIEGDKLGRKGVDELSDLLNLVEEAVVSKHISVDPTLARGLSYYTGAIFEINVPDLAGSLGGGGRYDGLIGMFGKEQIPACGFSLGLERILVVMEEREMFPKELADASADVMVTIWNEESTGESLKFAAELRRENLRVLVYPETDKLGKQFKYADSIKIPFVCVLGETELAENKVTLKNLRTGEQETIERGQASEKIKNTVKF